MDDRVYDLCVVGAGMFGTAAARHASAVAGVKVCLIGPDEPSPEERSTREIFSPHYDEGRITRTLEEDIPSEILSRNSINRYRELEQLSGINFYHPVGLLYITKKNSSFSKKVLQSANSLDLPVVDLSYNDIFQKRFPYIKLTGDDDLPLLDDFGAGHISPRNVVAAQKKVAKNQGCDIISEVVSEVKPLVKGIHEIITECGRILKAKRILICTGAFTNLKKFPMPKLKMKMKKETVGFFKLPLKEAQRLSAMPSIIYNNSEENFDAYILPPIQYPDGNFYLKIGQSNFGDKDNYVSTLEEIKEWYLSKGNLKEVKTLEKFLTNFLRGLNFANVTNMTCVTSYSPSGQPYIDRVSPTVTVTAVGNGKGAKFSDEVGRIAATLSLTGRWDSELSKSHFKAVFEN